ncbi:hypothetical protein [Piscirickettsia litoralis]|uniref:C-type lysozyme inhibitor domain-containing protein n=1 Tax=Piscirickettsia litoralis TaxID=1891921 RepID=A0ABX3A7F3_9GAMM|nr:hypothetical protein [Piscirickettsia litoralis]ODN43445.1 hypothetical protein BGC07_11590 [Piscirickettsia litoralis]
MKLIRLLAMTLTGCAIATASIASDTPPPLQGTQCQVGQQCTMSNGMAYFEISASRKSYGLYTCQIISGDKSNTHVVTVSTGKDAQNLYLARVGTRKFRLYIQEKAPIFRRYNGVGELKFVGTSSDAIWCKKNFKIQNDQ